MAFTIGKFALKKKFNKKIKVILQYLLFLWVTHSIIIIKYEGIKYDVVAITCDASAIQCDVGTLQFYIY